MEDVTEKSVAIAGLPGAAMRSLERVPIRMRESGATVSAWRMTIDSEDGTGTITLVDLPAGSVYRGEGAFLGWPQEQLANAYRALNAPAAEPSFELMQLG